MIARFRNWLADRLRTHDGARAPAPALTVAKEPPVGPAAPRHDEQQAAKRLRQAEERARQAEERTRRCELSRAELEASAKTVETRVNAALERAKRAEQALKKELDARPRHDKRRTGKANALEAKLRAAEDQLRAARSRAQAAERSLDDSDQREREVTARVEELSARAEELRQRAEDAETRAIEAERPRLAKDLKEGAGTRGRPPTTVDVYFSPGDECLTAIRRQFELSQRRVDICVFTITDDRITSSILDAHRRGVVIRLITDNDKTHDAGSDIRQLERAGIVVREDRTEFHMHHKFALFDGRTVLTGSYNWTRGAARYNEENLVVSSDVRLIGPFEREFNELWSRLGRE